MIRASWIKRYPRMTPMSGLGGLGQLGIAFTVTSGIAKASTSVDLGIFKSVQRALNQWWIKNGASTLALVNVDGQLGAESLQGVRDGITHAIRRGNAISMQEPGGVYDLAQHALEYATTFASLAGVNVDVDPSCRTTDYRDDRRACTNPTVPPVGTLYAPTAPIPVPEPSDPGPAVAPSLPTAKPVAKSSMASGLFIAVGLALTVGAVAMLGKDKKRSAVSMMGLRCAACRR